MKTGEKDLALIKHFEGLRLRAYQCSGLTPAGNGSPDWYGEGRWKENYSCTIPRLKLFQDFSCMHFFQKESEN